MKGTIGFGIGIVNNKNHHCSTSQMINAKKGAYVYYCDGYLSPSAPKSKVTITEGDVAEFIVDFKQQTMTINKNNGQMKATLFKNIEKDNSLKYKLGVNLYNLDDSIEFLESP